MAPAEVAKGNSATRERTLFDIVVLREIVAPAQYLDVRRIFRRTALRIRDDVVEMKAGSRATGWIHTMSLIAFPYLEFHPTRNQPIVIQCDLSDGRTVALVGACEPEFELEDLPASGLLGPTINQFEKPVVYPNTRPYFLVDSDSLWACRPFLVFPHSFRKKSVLCQ